MRSVTYRLNAVLSFALVPLALLLATASFLDGFNSPAVQAHAHVHKIHRFRKQINGNDEAKLSLNISVDAKSLFTWNTKQVFVFFAAEYQTPKNSINKVSLWDHIIPDKDHAKFQTIVLNKYSLIDQGSNLRGQNIKLVLHWHIMPKTGKMIRDKMFESNFSLPESYS